MSSGGESNRSTQEEEVVQFWLQSVKKRCLLWQVKVRRMMMMMMFGFREVDVKQSRWPSSTPDLRPSGRQRRSPDNNLVTGRGRVGREEVET